MRKLRKFTLTSLIFSVAFLAFFLFDMIGKGIPAFNIAYIKVDVTQLSHLNPSSFAVTSLNRSIMAVKSSFLLTTLIS